MNRLLRTGFIALGLICGILTIGFGFQMPWATGLWMWPDGRLTYIFIASITAAIGAPLFWIGFTGEWGAAASGALNLLVTSAGTAVFLFQLAGQAPDSPLLIYAVTFGLLALTNIAILLWGRRYPVHDQRPIPRPVYASFALFATVLTLVSGALLLKLPVVFPWPLKAETSVIIGWIFAGPVLYFASVFLRPGWGNAQGQLLGFLAYDLVLILPFLQHFSTVLPEHRPSLTIYTLVVIFSGVLAAYYLFLHKPTRMWSKQ